MVGYQTRPQALVEFKAKSREKQNMDFAAFLPWDPPSQYWAMAATKTGWPDNYLWRDNIIFKNYYLFDGWLCDAKDANIGSTWQRC